jgi:uncharacterized protein (TIGR02246 family)
MPARATTPNDTHRLWTEAFQRGDLDGLVALYEEDAAFLAEPGAAPITGKGPIRDALTAFLSIGASFDIERTETVEGPDLALVYSRWTLKGGSDADGNPVDVAGETTDVVRRQADGGWLFAVDNPWGLVGVGLGPG